MKDVDRMTKPSTTKMVSFGQAETFFCHQKMPKNETNPELSKQQK